MAPAAGVSGLGLKVGVGGVVEEEDEDEEEDEEEAPAPASSSSSSAAAAVGEALGLGLGSRPGGAVVERARIERESSGSKRERPEEAPERKDAMDDEGDEAERDGPSTPQRSRHGGSRIRRKRRRSIIKIRKRK